MEPRKEEEEEEEEEEDKENKKDILQQCSALFSVPSKLSPTHSLPTYSVTIII
jgi:hypothetical protein